LGVSSARPGVGSVSLGTSGVIVVPLETPTAEPEGRVHLFCHADGGYFFLGCTLSAAGSLQWFRDQITPQVAFEDLMFEAERAPSGSDGLVWMPYLAGERSPYLDPDLRGAWLGLSLAHTRAHMIRSVLEGVTFSLRDTLERMNPIVPAQKLLAIGGGARSSLWLGMVGNALGVPLEKPALEEGPARGAAILALVGAGVYPTVAAAIDATSPQAELVNVTRDAALEGAYANYKRGYQAVSAYKG
jgi:xylulokinase